jgi:hypothetical protein
MIAATCNGDFGRVKRRAHPATHWIVTLAACLGMLTLPLVAWADEHEEGAAQEQEQEFEEEAETASSRASGGEITFDVLLLRPIGAVSTVVGLGFFVGSAPFAAPSWTFEDTWDAFVVGPMDTTFSRPLGEI